MRDTGETARVRDTSALTALQRAVLTASARGLSVGEVAACLGLAPERVRAALRSSFEKLGANSKLEAVVIALTRGLIDAPSEPDGS